MLGKEISPNIKRIMPGGAFPAWSPVMNKVTFTKKISDKYEVCVMDPNGKNVQCLTGKKPALKDCGHRGQSYWHPGGKYIVFSAENAKYPRQGFGVPHRPGLGRNLNVWIMTADGEKFRQLTDYPKNWGVIETKFSHDGTKIACMLSTGFDIDWGDIKKSKKNLACRPAKRRTSGAPLIRVVRCRETKNL